VAFEMQFDDGPKKDGLTSPRLPRNIAAEVFCLQACRALLEGGPRATAIPEIVRISLRPMIGYWMRSRRKCKTARVSRYEIKRIGRWNTSA
jgi:hypothetical protein